MRDDIRLAMDLIREDLRGFFGDLVGGFLLLGALLVVTIVVYFGMQP